MFMQVLKTYNSKTIPTVYFKKFLEWNFSSSVSVPNSIFQLWYLPLAYSLQLLTKISTVKWPIGMKQMMLWYEKPKSKFKNSI